MWACGFLVFNCLGFFLSLTGLCFPSLPQKRRQRQASEKDSKPKIPATWRPVDTIPLKSALQNTMAAFPRPLPMAPKTWGKALQSRQHQESPTAVEKLLSYIKSLLNLSWGKFYSKSWLCATLPGQTGSCGDGTGDASGTHALENSSLGMCWGPAGITSLLFTRSPWQFLFISIGHKQSMSVFQK